MSQFTRRQGSWAVALTIGIVPWAAYLRPYSFEGFLLLGLALVLALVVTFLLVALRSPGWLIVVVLLPMLVACSSAATFLTVALGIDGAEAIHPINGYTVVFGGLWAFFTLLVRVIVAGLERLAAD